MLKFAYDRSRFVAWLLKTRKRFSLQILNYTISSNHVHLLVKGNDEGNTISSAIQLVADRTGQEYNQRKRRKGAFGEDRYHATAIDSGEHLRRCLVYMDLNMVRAGVVAHPADWAFGGYHEIQGNRRRNRLLNLDILAEVTETNGAVDLASFHPETVLFPNLCVNLPTCLCGVKTTPPRKCSIFLTLGKITHFPYENYAVCILSFRMHTSYRSSGLGR